MKEEITRVESTEAREIEDIWEVSVIDLGDGEFDTHSHCRRCSLACRTEEKKENEEK